MVSGEVETKRNEAVVLYCLGICLKILRRTTKVSFTVGVPTEIRTVHLPN
jgi:hypothetical protein